MPRPDRRQAALSDTAQLRPVIHLAAGLGLLSEAEYDRAVRDLETLVTNANHITDLERRLLAHQQATAALLSEMEATVADGDAALTRTRALLARLRPLIERTRR